MSRKKYNPPPQDRQYKDDDLLNSHEAGNVIKCGLTKLYELRKEKKLEHIEIESRIFYQYKDLKEFINRHRRPRSE